MIKGNFGLYRNSPGPSLFNPNPSLWYKEYNWVDRNNDGVWQIGEQDGSPTNSAGGITNEIVDLEYPHGRDDRGRRLPGAGSDAELRRPHGLVYRHLTARRRGSTRIRPLSAYNVPVSVQDPGPDGRLGTGDEADRSRRTTSIRRRWRAAFSTRRPRSTTSTATTRRGS